MLNYFVISLWITWCTFLNFERNLQDNQQSIAKHTCSKPGSLWYGFSDINDWIEIKRDDIHWAGDHDGPLHVLKIIWRRLEILF